MTRVQDIPSTEVASLLNDKSEGLKNAKINNKKVYYFSDANGRCSKLTKIVVGDVEYEF